VLSYRFLLVEGFVTENIDQQRPRSKPKWLSSTSGRVHTALGRPDRKSSKKKVAASDRSLRYPARQCTGIHLSAMPPTSLKLSHRTFQSQCTNPRQHVLCVTTKFSRTLRRLLLLLPGTSPLSHLGIPRYIKILQGLPRRVLP
jgi:hypothetical protein